MSDTVHEPSVSPLSYIESDYLQIEIDDVMVSRAEAEQQNEIVALNETDGEWKLDLGNGFHRQWEEIIAALIARPNDEFDQVSRNSNTSQIDDWAYLIEDKVFTISLLGNTSSGKSFIAQHLLDESHDDAGIHGPVCIDEKEKKGATTANINCYLSQSIRNQKTLVLDYEGEKGSAFPLLHYARRNLRHLSRTVKKAQHRRQAVADYFPKLAYILSDVVIVIGNDDLASTGYLTRCHEFALKANNGVNQVVYRPMLIIIQNKASLAQSLRFEVITQKFFDIHGKEAHDLRSYFSSIKCFCLPHKEQLQRTKTGTLDGLEIFNQQIADLKNIFVALSNHHNKRALTHAQWLYLLQRVLPIVQSGSLVSLHTLRSEIVAYDNNQIMNTTKLCFLYSYNSVPIHSPAWFDNCCRFAIRVLAHCLSVNAYSQRELIPARVIHEQCEKALEQLSNVLEKFQPCEALYPGKGCSSKTKDDEHPVYCYQHRGAHEGGHRTCESVYGLTPWKELWGWCSTDVWPGDFVPSTKPTMKNTIFSNDIIEDLPDLVVEQMNAFRQDPEATYYLFTDLLLSNQFSEQPLEIFSRICFCGSNLTSASVDSDGLWNDLEHQTRRSRLDLITMTRSLLLSSLPQSSAHTWATCRKCVRKLSAAWTRLSIHPTSPLVHIDSPFSSEVSNCAICFDDQRNFLFIPCGHRGFCESCANTIINKNSLCPFCRAPITGKQRVHDV
jgi:hypothetical protein